MTDPVDFIPAGPAWRGRKAPRYQPHGSFHRSPPHAPPAPIAEDSREPADPIAILALGVAVTGVVCISVAWAIIRYWPA